MRKVGVQNRLRLSVHAITHGLATAKQSCLPLPCCLLGT